MFVVNKVLKLYQLLKGWIISKLLSHIGCVEFSSSANILCTRVLCSCELRIILKMVLQRLLSRGLRNGQ